MSDSRDAANNALNSVLSKHNYLNLYDRVFDINALKSNVGGTGDVYRAKLRRLDGKMITVAIKRVRECLKANEGFAKLFAKEMNVWAKLFHDNIIPLKGYILENDFPAIVSEWAEGGTINEYIKEHPDCDLVITALGIANGLAYLHENKIIHADLKGANVLMSGAGVPMLTDFGQSRILDNSQSMLKTTTYGNLKGTACWIAYELLCFVEGLTAPIICTEASDMWAFGMVVYEIISGKLPYADVAEGPIAEFRIMQAIRKKQLPAKPPINCWEKELLWNICIACWKHAPEDRMTVHQAIDALSVHSIPISPGPMSSASIPISPGTTSSTSTFLHSDISVEKVKEGMENMRIKTSDANEESSFTEGSNTKATIYLTSLPALDLSSSFEFERWTQDFMIGPPVKSRKKSTLENIPSSFTLFSRRFKGGFQSDWQIRVDGGPTLTNYDVLRAIYASLFTRMDEKEREKVDRRWMEEAEKACARRCRLYGGMEGLRRVDFLREFRWLKGIQKVEHAQYILVTRKSQTKGEQDKDV